MKSKNLIAVAFLLLSASLASAQQVATVEEKALLCRGAIEIARLDNAMVDVDQCLDRTEIISVRAGKGQRKVSGSIIFTAKADGIVKGSSDVVYCETTYTGIAAPENYPKVICKY
jgi:hypothetical protein